MTPNSISGKLTNTKKYIPKGNNVYSADKNSGNTKYKYLLYLLIKIQKEIKEISIFYSEYIPIHLLYPIISEHLLHIHNKLINTYYIYTENIQNIYLVSLSITFKHININANKYYNTLYSGLTNKLKSKSLKHIYSNNKIINFIINKYIASNKENTKANTHKSLYTKLQYCIHTRLYIVTHKYSSNNSYSDTHLMCFY